MLSIYNEGSRLRNTHPIVCRLACIRNLTSTPRWARSRGVALAGAGGARARI